jgi:PAS domain-containing protein
MITLICPCVVVAAAASVAGTDARSPPIVSQDPSVLVAPAVDYASIFKGGQVPQVISDLQGRFIDCNQAFIDLTGWALQNQPFQSPILCLFTEVFLPNRTCSQVAKV